MSCGNISENDIVAFLGLNPDSVEINPLEGNYVVSVKPDPGYSGLVLYTFEFYSVKFIDPPDWLSFVRCEVKLDYSRRQFKWSHPEELEQDTSAMHVNANVIRGIHQLFSTTIQTIPQSVPKGFLHHSLHDKRILLD